MSLEDIIRNKWIEWYGEYPVEDFTENMEEIAQAIRDAGYVRIEDLELDKQFVGDLLSERIILTYEQKTWIAKSLATHAKDIIKVKESK